MSCPDCHCPRGEPLTVATNSLVTRCHNAFHAVAVSPARPGDFATETAKDTTPPPPSHHGAAEAVLGHPYTTPIPTTHDGSTGWVFCNSCESPQPVSGHECAGSRDAGEALESAARWYGEASAKGPGPNLDDAKAELRKCALAFAARGGGR